MAADDGTAAHLGPLAAHVDSVLDGLCVAGYAPTAVTCRRGIINAFIRRVRQLGRWRYAASR